MTDKHIDLSDLLVRFKQYCVKEKYSIFAATIESSIQASLMVSWVFYVMKPVLQDVENYGISTSHYDPIVVLGLCGFVFLSFWFLMSFVWYYNHKYSIKLVMSVVRYHNS